MKTIKEKLIASAFLTALLVGTISNANAQWVVSGANELLNGTTTGVKGSSTTNGALQINANGGSLTIGAQNSTWCHFFTSNSLFYFDKPIYINTGILASYINQNLSLQTGSTPRITVLNSNGFVGINNTNPTQMLHINNGAILVQGTVPGVGGAQILIGGTVGAQTYGQYGIEYQTASDVGLAYGGLNFWKPVQSSGLAGSNNILFLSDNAKVGINTTNPTAQLTVNGTTLIGDPAIVTNLPAGYKLYVQSGILAEKVRVALASSTAWADYVFGKDYKLMPIAQVANYISTNQHLPGVPSATEVSKAGIDMAEMDATLLKKIEELTLYMIEQNKQLTEDKQKIAELQTLVSDLKKN
jgi:hypothetical protein